MDALEHVEVALDQARLGQDVHRELEALDLHGYVLTAKSPSCGMERVPGTTGGGQNPNDEMSFDHVTLVTMDEDGPHVAHLRLDGILDEAVWERAVETQRQALRGLAES